MGFRGISVGSILIILLIVLILFGAKRFRNIGEDLGSALKGFRKGLKDESSESSTPPSTIENENKSEKTNH